MKDFALDYRCEQIGNAQLIHADCFDWLRRVPECSIDVTDNYAAYLSSADRAGQCLSSIPLEQSDVEAS
jgi:hypothetical protein